MKITAIKQQAKNSERANIFVNGKYSFSLHLNELVAERLKVGQEIDEPELKRLKKLSEDGKLKMHALEWVMNRPRSIREFRDYMHRKKADPEIIENLLQEFMSRGYINETSFTEWLIGLRRRQGKSERTIRAELMRKGIGREIISEAMSDSGGEIERLKELVARKRRLTRYKTDPNKLMRYLVGQGFSYDDVKSVLRVDD